MLSRYFPDIWVSFLESHCKGTKLIDLIIRVLINKMPTHIAFKTRCEQLKKDISNLNSNLDNSISNGDYSPEDLKMLKGLKISCEAYENFVRAAGSSESAGYISKDDMSKAARLFDFKIVEVFSGKYCVPIYEVQIRSYTCWLALNEGNETKTVTIQYSTNKKGSTGKMQMGLMGGYYRSFKNNGEEPVVTKLDVAYINCIGSY